MLADWLEESAKPIPDHVLEGAIQASSRRAQSARLGLPRGPGGLLRVATVAAAAAIVVIAVVSASSLVDRIGSFIGSAPGPRDPMAWDPESEYRVAPDHLNPSPDAYGNPDVWSYMRSTWSSRNPDEYILLTDYEDLGNGGEHWHESGMAWMAVGHAPGEPAIFMHPWASADQVRFAVLRWRSPVTARIAITGDARVADTCGDGVSLYVDHEGDNLFAVDVGRSLERFDTTTAVKSGESLYFVVEPGHDSSCDSTILRLAIRAPADED